jgi:hypothetical protein
MAGKLPKFKTHIERLKFNISEMEVASRGNAARLIASEALVEEQQRIINSNALLLQALQLQRNIIQLCRQNISEYRSVCWKAKEQGTKKRRLALRLKQK